MLTSLLALNFLGTSTRVKEHRGLSTCFCRFRPLRFPNPLTLTARFTEPQAPNTGRIGEDLKILLQFLLSKSKRHSQIVSSRSKNTQVCYVQFYGAVKMAATTVTVIAPLFSPQIPPKKPTRSHE